MATNKKNPVNKAIIFVLVLVTFLVVFTYFYQKKLSGGNGSGISIAEDAQLAPSHTYKVEAELNNSNISVRWMGTGDDRITKYQVYRKTEGGEWEKLAGVNISGDNHGMYEYLDTKPVNGIKYIYGVEAVNSYGKKSSITQSQVVNVQ